MNIKSLRKDYKTLTYIERNALFISALQRDDKSEIDAIYAATPRKNVSEIDFYQFKQDLITLQMMVIIEKADCWNSFLMFSEYTKPKHKGSDGLSLYIFFTLTEAWKTVCDEIGIDADAFEQMLFPNNFLLFRLTAFQNAFREFAYTEAEATKFCKKYFEFEGELAFTLEKKIAFFRKFLELPEK